MNTWVRIPVGVVLERSKDLLADMSELQQMFRTAPAALSGRLRVDMPLAIARELVIPQLPDFLRQHPQGYEMPLGERGEGLSGGQRQSIALARALVSRPPIMLLDEPTSAMDLSRETQLIENFKNQLSNQTILIITHRTSILELATKVMVIDQGKIVAQGPKSEFMRSQQQQAMKAQESAESSV